MTPFQFDCLDIKLETHKHTRAQSTREGLRWVGLCGQEFVPGVWKIRPESWWVPSVHQVRKVSEGKRWPSPDQSLGSGNENGSSGQMIS